MRTTMNFKIKRIAAASIILAMLTLSAACSGNSKTSETETSSEYSGFEHIDSLDGKSLGELGLLGEKLTVLNVWATWCPPCIGELPHLEDISQHFNGNGVKVIGIMQDGVNETFEPQENTIANGITLLENAGVTYPNLVPDADFFSQYIAEMQVFPTTYFLDADGNIISTLQGAQDFDGWKDTIDDALNELS